MIRLQRMPLLGGLLLAAALIAGCTRQPAGPTPTTTLPTPQLPDGTVTVVTPVATAPSYPDPATTPGYPAPTFPAPTPGYPEPLPVTPNADPYPAPTPSGGAPGAPPAGGDPGAPATGGAPAPVAGGAPALAVPVAEPAAAAAPILRPVVVATYPHDPRAYTQGLVYIGADTFYEGTGWYADSSLREVALATGEVSRQTMLSMVLGPDLSGRPAFGEGIAVVGERIFQLSWLNGAGVIYDRSFQPVGQFTYPPPNQPGPREGWGLTYDSAAGRLIMSDGSATLYFVDPARTAETGVLAITGQVTVRDPAGQEVWQLNELELIKGEVYANIYQSELIARIDPATGQVKGYLDLSGLRPLLIAQPGIDPPEVLNGIAYDEAGDRLFVTGKRWPSLFEIDLPVARAYLPVATVVRPAVPLVLWS